MARRPLGYDPALMSLAPGTRIGPYEIVAAAGAYAYTYGRHRNDLFVVEGLR